MAANQMKTSFQDAVAGLLAGDFSRLAPLFADDVSAAGQRCALIAWIEQGLFLDTPLRRRAAADFSRGFLTHGKRKRIPRVA